MSIRLKIYSFPLLNGFSIPCLVTQKASPAYRRLITNVFGGAEGNEGMGLLEMSFDWQYISSVILSYPIRQQGSVSVFVAELYSYLFLSKLVDWLRILLCRCSRNILL